MDSPFWAREYVDDVICVELLRTQEDPTGARCLLASASLASDHFRLFGSRPAGYPPLFSSKKLTSWSSCLEVLGWEIDTMPMSISHPPAKLIECRNLLRAWEGRVAASETEVRSLMGKLLHVCEVIRPGKLFVRRMPNQLGMPPGQRRIDTQAVQRMGLVYSGRENLSHLLRSSEMTFILVYTGGRGDGP